MVDFDVEFHRYFSSLSSAKRAVYKGRLDLDTFTPSEFSTAFASIRDLINERFAINVQRIVTPTGPATVYMDYVDASAKNALSFESKGIYFIGITSGMLQHFVTACSALWRLNPLADLLGIQLNKEGRDFLFQALLLLQVQFIADHELGHMFHGHCEGLYKGFLFEEFATPKDALESGASKLKDQAHEVEADGYAVEMMMNGLFRDSVGSFLITRLRPFIAQDEFLLLLYILAVAALLYWLPAVDFDVAAIRTSDHPRGIVRMNVVMRDILRWCSENRTDLIPLVSVERFQWVLACVQVAADNQRQQAAWLAQGVYLKSDAGQAYMAELYEAREVLRSEMSTKRWKLALPS
jgi:hypothetical protein